VPDRPSRPGEDARLRGLRLLRLALAGVVLFAVAATAWTLRKAPENPDVRTRRPGWLDGAAGFDVAFWTPLLVTVVVGAGLVFYVFWRAYRRLRAGEDLYARRYGRPEPPGDGA
jgi:hypothetical protein